MDCDRSYKVLILDKATSKMDDLTNLQEGQESFVSILYGETIVLFSARTSTARQNSSSILSFQNNAGEAGEASFVISQTTKTTSPLHSSRLKQSPATFINLVIIE
jgi:ABC-type bacteriocin/lantibiotic exporter with double-glycine peptidase domain